MPINNSFLMGPVIWNHLNENINLSSLQAAVKTITLNKLSDILTLSVSPIDIIAFYNKFDNST